MKHAITKKVGIELADETYLEVEVTARYMRDTNYGADADGNRGMDTGWQVDELDYADPVRADGTPFTAAEREEISDKLLAVTDTWDPVEDEIDYSDERQEYDEDREDRLR